MKAALTTALALGAGALLHNSMRSQCSFMTEAYSDRKCFSMFPPRLFLALSFDGRLLGSMGNSTCGICAAVDTNLSAKP